MKKFSKNIVEKLKISFSYEIVKSLIYIMPFTPSYDNTTLQSDPYNIGYSPAPTSITGATFSGSTPVNITNCSISIATTGVWIVEAQIYAYCGSDPPEYFYWSLSNSSGIIDYSRLNYVWIQGKDNANLGNHMTSVFIVNGLTDNTIYMVGAFQTTDGSATSDSFATMTYTRIA
jgi:hypothetical protein